MTRGAAATGLLVPPAALTGTLVYRSVRSPVRPVGDVSRGHRGSRAVPDGGGLPNGGTVFAEECPGVADLAPDLVATLRAAANEYGCFAMYPDPAHGQGMQQ
ncbi:hypothetical protein HGA13_25645 [Nocardia speluncae]|uniref:Uncharacterized protein n=1 Tax=Nocardia speluncae TaxID=419477 RepID=A0A846XM69_9NOCA|nr:hypothetical protein [Nocardia speluncae]NKY36425.1 hypothetical protein [Nocardia speluncae]